MSKNENLVTDSSNSRLHTPFSTKNQKNGSPETEENESAVDVFYHPNIEKLSIDKIRIVGDFNMRYVNELFEINNKKLDINLIDDEHFKGQFVADNGSTLNFEYNNAKAQATKSANFWVEWNPNKIKDAYLHGLAPLFDNVNKAHTTRIDIAFDIDKDLSNYTVYKDKPIAHRVFYGRDSNIETRYFGSPNSDRYIKIYNKKLELWKNERIQIDQDVLWRFEITLKTKKIEDITNALTGIHLYLPAYEMIDNVQERAMLYYLNSNPQNFNEINPKTKTKYRNLIRDTQDFNLTKILDKKLQEEKDRLLKQINGYLEMYNTAKKIIS